MGLVQSVEGLTSLKGSVTKKSFSLPLFGLRHPSSHTTELGLGLEPLALLLLRPSDLDWNDTISSLAVFLFHLWSSQPRAWLHHSLLPPRPRGCRAVLILLFVGLCMHLLHKVPSTSECLILGESFYFLFLFFYVYEYFFILFIYFSFIFISWRLITLQYCSGFCHTLTWISHGFTCVPHPDPSSHLPLHPIPLGLPSAPALSTCLMHPTWAGDLFHPW